MAKEAKHTPGPWKINSSGERIFSQFRLIAEVSFPIDISYFENKANAQLIASAPTMLAERDQLKAQNEAMNLQQNRTLNACKVALSALMRVKPQITGALCIEDVEFSIRECSTVIDASVKGQLE